MVGGRGVAWATLRRLEGLRAAQTRRWRGKGPQSGRDWMVQNHARHSGGPILTGSAGDGAVRDRTPTSEFLRVLLQRTGLLLRQSSLSSTRTGRFGRARPYDFHSARGYSSQFARYLKRRRLGCRADIQPRRAGRKRLLLGTATARIQRAKPRRAQLCAEQPKFCRHW